MPPSSGWELFKNGCNPVAHKGLESFRAAIQPVEHNGAVRPCEGVVERDVKCRSDTGNELR